jgi:hypothetical protein
MRRDDASASELEHLHRRGFRSPENKQQGSKRRVEHDDVGRVKPDV